MAAAARGDWPGAEAAVRALLQAAPDNASLHYNLSLALRNLGEFGPALDAARQALALAPGHQGALFQQAACLMDLGRLLDAETAFTRYIERFPGDPEGRQNRARIRLRLGKPQDALADCEAALSGTAELKLHRAEALRDLGRLDEAQAILLPLYRDNRNLRPAILKIITHGPVGSVALNAGELVSPAE